MLPHYDSLLSLLICHGNNRQEAIFRMRRALYEYLIEGIKTTIPFHLAVLHNKNFLKGDITTAFIERNKILECVEDYCWKKEKDIADEQKVIIVTTAVSRYMEKKNGNNKASAWVQAGRQELMEKEL